MKSVDLLQPVFLNDAEKDYWWYLKQIAKDAKKENKIPELARIIDVFTNKKYYSPKQYPPTNYLQLTLALHYGNLALYPEKDRNLEWACLFLVLNSLIDYEVPFYWVTSDLLSALQNTQIKDDIQVKDMRFALNAATFVFPHNALKTPEGLNVHFISYTKTEGDFKAGNLTIKCVKGDKDQLNFFTVCKLLDSRDLFANYWRKTDCLRGEDEFSLRSFDESNREAEEKFMRQLESIVFQLITIHASRPDLIEKGISKEDPTKTKGFKKFNSPAPVIWSPNWIGKSYQIKTKTQKTSESNEENKRRSPRSHWRIGHLRMTACGKERKDRKVVWIEPCFIRGEKP